MMPPDDDVKRRFVRRLARRKKISHHATMDIPARLQVADDADDDCTAPAGSSPYMNQSLFGMIAAAGSRVDFNARFDGQSSDEEEVEDTADGVPHAPVASTTTLPTGVAGRLRRISESTILRSMPRRTGRSKSRSATREMDPAVAGASTAESAVETATEPVDATSLLDVTLPLERMDTTPVMERMLEAQAELTGRPSFETPPSPEAPSPVAQIKSEAISLAQRLAEIFGFETPEDVVAGMFPAKSHGWNLYV